MTLEAAGISSYCEVICGLDLHGGAGAETKFKSIPVANLRKLLQRIKTDFDDWVKKENPVYQKRYDGDKLAGEAVVWNGFSGSVQYYFKTKDINPSEKYKDLYSEKMHTIAVSYVWSGTGLFRMACKWILSNHFHSSVYMYSFILLAITDFTCFQLNSSSLNTRVGISSSTSCVCLRKT